ncbi:hypothetical protein V1478_018364 [Vespula squamosa]|uniref:Uncharacterized protein n=1 Tax=Vespula squamosa TaxID=30214 RepID=A0ABD1ZUT6_VESSQ
MGNRALAAAIHGCSSGHPRPLCEHGLGQSKKFVKDTTPILLVRPFLLELQEIDDDDDDVDDYDDDDDDDDYDYDYDYDDDEDESAGTIKTDAPNGKSNADGLKRVSDTRSKRARDEVQRLRYAETTKVEDEEGEEDEEDENSVISENGGQTNEIRGTRGKEKDVR